MNWTRGVAVCLVTAGCALCSAATAREGEFRLVFGSFRNAANAEGWAQAINKRHLPVQARVLATEVHGTTTFRVVSQALAGSQFQAARQAAEAMGFSVWRMAAEPAVAGATRKTQTLGSKGVPHTTALPAPPDNPVDPDLAAAQVVDQPNVTEPGHVGVDRDDSHRVGKSEFDVDFGVQTRTYQNVGVHGQSRFHSSFSAEVEFFQSWNDRTTFTIRPFLRYDFEDAERTHFDLRDAYLSRIGEGWELHAGVKRVFWGVTEFVHLVDIVNQTDFVENVDGEDKLGQPMVNLSLVRGWGIVDVFLLAGFRERTFPSLDGRLGAGLAVADPVYESASGAQRVDGAIRWSQQIGALGIGLSHFKGTSREPVLVPIQSAPTNVWMLEPHYRLIDQTGLDAQIIVGDWALKLEAINRSGQGRRFAAFTAGLEKTVVGIFRSRTDLGLVVEYMWDERRDAATTLLQNDVALGARWLVNDVADSQALLGVILDARSNEYIVQLEASRRLSEVWSMTLEARLFGGGRAFRASPPVDLEEPWNPFVGALRRDDVLQVDFTRFF